MPLDLVKDIMYKWSKFLFFTNENHVQQWKSYFNFGFYFISTLQDKKQTLPKEYHRPSTDLSFISYSLLY